ncbi:hypothetical protein Bbelb_307870 [Branchiostoma belcheri]|nr:hypothetical protein Bbelb_307870 [Branchiostoma belcheri]
MFGDGSVRPDPENRPESALVWSRHTNLSHLSQAGVVHALGYRRKPAGGPILVWLPGYIKCVLLGRAMERASTRGQPREKTGGCPMKFGGVNPGMERGSSRGPPREKSRERPSTVGGQVGSVRKRSSSPEKRAANGETRDGRSFDYSFAYGKIMDNRKKTDVLNRYFEYKRIWDKHRYPGENTKELLWSQQLKERQLRASRHQRKKSQEAKEQVLSLMAMREEEERAKEEADKEAYEEEVRRQQEEVVPPPPPDENPSDDESDDSEDEQKDTNEITVEHVDGEESGEGHGSQAENVENKGELLETAVENEGLENKGETLETKAEGLETKNEKRETKAEHLESDGVQGKEPGVETLKDSKDDREETSESENRSEEDKNTAQVPAKVGSNQETQNKDSVTNSETELEDEVFQ